MKAILTKYFGPGNVRGSRIKADDGDGNTVMVPYNHALNGEGNHRAAAEALCNKMDWNGRLVGGGLKHGMAWVFVD